MGLAEVIEALTEEAEAEARHVLQEGGREAEDLLEQCRTKQEERRRRALGDRESDLRVSHRASMTALKQESMAEALKAREELIERILETVEAMLDEVVSAEEYAETVRRGLEEARTYLAGLRARVICGGSSESLVLDACAHFEGIEVVPRSGIGPGFLVESTDGSVCIDATLSAKLRARRSKVARGALARLALSDGVDRLVEPTMSGPGEPVVPGSGEGCGPEAAQ